MDYVANDICIVGFGCVLPDASNSDSFWKNLVTGHCSIKNIPESKIDPLLYYSLKRSYFTTYTTLAGIVNDEALKSFAYENNLQDEPFHRLFLGTLKSAQEAILPLGETFAKAKKVDLYMGAAGSDVSLYDKENLREIGYYESFFEKNNDLTKASREYFTEKFGTYSKEKYAYASLTLHKIKKNLNLVGEVAIFDAACASSLAAIDHSINKLRSYQSDLVITGGMEADTTPVMLAVFSYIKGLSKKPCLPFDSRADGLSLGEGSVSIVLQRLEDAQRDGNQIYGVIRSVASSSDGGSSSLLAPTESAQVKAFDQAYRNLDKEKVKYLECHGTGTKLGDKTELSSIFATFGKMKLPIGSSKYNVGHTRGAAGAVGLLKSILIFKNKTIPASPYFKKFTHEKSANNLFLNTKNIDLDVSAGDLIGVSSFGFGGINYHLVLEAPPSRVSFDKAQLPPLSSIAAIGETVEISKEDLEKVSDRSFFKISPRSIKEKQVDSVQLQAVVGVSRLIYNLGIPIALFDNSKIGVISSIPSVLSTMFNLHKRVQYKEVVSDLSLLHKRLGKASADRWLDFGKQSFETIPGALNNIIAARVCNTFNFKGLSLNIDSDHNSYPVALDFSRHILNSGSLDLIFLITSDVKYSGNEHCLKNGTVKVSLLSLPSVARRNGLAISSILEDLTYVQ